MASNPRMHLLPRSCSPAATNQIWKRRSPYVSLESLGSAKLHGWVGKGSASTPRHIHSFSRSGFGKNIGPSASGALSATSSECARPGAVSRGYLKWNRISPVSKADLTPVSSDSLKVEELLESPEVQEVEKKVRLQRQVLGGDGKGLQSQFGTQGEGWPERMTKGNIMSLSLLSKISWLTGARQNAHNAVATFQIDHFVTSR